MGFTITRYATESVGGVVMMNTRRLLELVVVFVIVVALAASPLSLVVWILLAWMAWKRKTGIFHDQMEPGLAKRRLKWLRALLLVGAMAFAMIWVSILLAGYVFHLPAELMDSVVRYIAFSFLGVFDMATAGGLVILLKGRRKTT